MVFTWVIMLAAFAMMVFTVISMTSFDQNDRDIFGYKAFIVRSDSMSATDFSAGDLVLVKETDPATLQEGDIIAFLSEDPASFGETFTHKIRSRITTGEGEPAFVTYGTTTDTDDAYPVTYESVLGKYERALPGVGKFFNFLKTPAGYICCILLVFGVLLVIQAANSVALFRQYRKEKAAEQEAQHRREVEELEDERRRLMQEQEKSRRLLEELRAMQSQTETEVPEGEAPAELPGEEEPDHTRENAMTDTNGGEK